MTDRASPSDWLEDIASLLPAVTLLQQIGYTYLTPEQALQKRGGKRSHVVLEEVLAEQLQRLNQIEYRGRKHDFSAANIQKAVEAISQFPYDALSTTSQALSVAKGKILLNPLLVSAPKECIDYVIIHELCHTLQHNHSSAFSYC
jgi:predicted metal-dependent hydrolase